MADTLRRSRARRKQAVPCRRLRDALFSRPAGALAGALSALAVLGCMGVAIGNRVADEPKPCAASDDGGVLTQEGSIPIRPGGERVVYYPIPYASPPNLELECEGEFCDIVEQKDSCFRVQFHGNFLTSRQSLAWKARGVRCPPPPAAPPAPPTEPTPPAALLPPAPTPVPTGPTGR